MVAPGAKGSFPSSTDDATKPKNIIALSNPHTRTTGFQGTRMYMPEPPGTKSGSRLPLLYCENPRLFMYILPAFLRSGAGSKTFRQVPHSSTNRVCPSFNPALEFTSLNKRGQFTWLDVQHAVQSCYFYCW